MSVIYHPAQYFHSSGAGHGYKRQGLADHEEVSEGEDDSISGDDNSGEEGREEAGRETEQKNTFQYEGK